MGLVEWHSALAAGVAVAAIVAVGDGRGVSVGGRAAGVLAPQDAVGTHSSTRRLADLRGDFSMRARMCSPSCD
jgi:hypothetical protein